MSRENRITSCMWCINAFPYTVQKRTSTFLIRGLIKTGTLGALLVLLTAAYFEYLVRTKTLQTVVLGEPLQNGLTSSALWERLSASTSYSCPCTNTFLCVETVADHDILLRTRNASDHVNVTLKVRSNECDEKATPTVKLDPKALEAYYDQHIVNKYYNEDTQGASTFTGLCMVALRCGTSPQAVCMDFDLLFHVCVLHQWAMEFNEIGSSHYSSEQGLQLRYTLNAVEGTANLRGKDQVLTQITSEFTSYHEQILPDWSSYPSYQNLKDASWLQHCKIASPTETAEAFSVALPKFQTPASTLNKHGRILTPYSLPPFLAVDMPTVLAGCQPESCTVTEPIPWFTRLTEAMAVLGGAVTILSIAVSGLVDGICNRLSSKDDGKHEVVDWGSNPTLATELVTSK